MQDTRVVDVYLIRHGEREDYVDPQWLEKAGHTRDDDPKLAALGHVQAKETAQRMKDLKYTADSSIKHVFSSPYVRCVNTASYIAEALDLPVQVENGICECVYSEPPLHLQKNKLKIEFPLVDTSWESTANPRKEESESQCGYRAAKAVQRVIEIVEQNMKPDEGPVALVFVAHGAPIAGIIRGLAHTGMMYVGLCTFTHLRRIKNSDKFKILEDGDSSHLSNTENLRPF